MTDSDTATPWPERLLLAMLAIVQGLEDPTAVSSITISGYDGRAELVLREEAWSLVAQGRSVTWDTDPVRGTATGTVKIGDVLVTAVWHYDGLLCAAPDVAALVFPAPQPKPTPTVTTWGGK